MPALNYLLKSSALSSPAIYSSMAGQIGWAVIAISVLVIVSWVFDIEAGKRLLPTFQSMKLNTALCFVTCGVILVRKAPSEAPPKDPVAALLALLLFLISGLTLFEYGSGLLLGIDNILIPDTATAPENWPGRMSVGTALCFSMIGAGWLIAVISGRHSILILQLLGLAVAIIGGAAVIGYAFGVKEFRLPVFSTMALHTAVLFVLCGVGMLFVRPGEGLMSSATSRFVGGRSLRRLFPFIAATPILMSWLSLQGVLAGYYSEAFGFALGSLSSILVLGFVGWLGADALNCEEERFCSTIDSSPVATIMIDELGIIRMGNRLAHSVLGYADNRLVGLSVEQLVPDQFRQGHSAYRSEYMIHAQQRIMGEGRELFALRQDGTGFRAEIALNPVQTADGRFVVAAIVDITERVAAEQKIMRLNRMHKVLSGINTLIVRSQSLDHLFECATRITVEEGGLSAALVVQQDTQSGKCTILRAHAAATPIEVRRLTGDEMEAVSDCVQHHRIVVRNDLAAFPLNLHEHALEAAFLLNRHESFSFDDSDMKLLQEVTGDISFAIAGLEKSQKLDYLTNFDNVTDLPNRLLLTDRLQQAIFQADSFKGLVSLLYVDIDRFKQVNDSLGHAGGDEVLRHVAK
ncbi:hypothetical protein GCM10022278_24570 [Allohahella marinimesophila]|uniref:PAS domain S-box-containing protein/diguanylate cyclase (GGDEF)-like protein n=1 Tax=Allohahella marinimesophila TaxID=1054972 RepID=A0ABP7PHJ3_9GAMM